MKLYAYNQGSMSAKALAQALDIKRIKHVGRAINIKGRVINWGSSHIERLFACDGLINPADSVAKACNKLTSFRLFKEAGVGTPEWTEGNQEANKWLAEGFDVVSRTVLNGHSGEGIVITTSKEYKEDMLANVAPKAQLHTKYVEKDQEYRIHVFQGEVFFQQRKARKLAVPDEDVNWKVRNLAGGFIFANADVVAPEDVRHCARLAVDSLGLDFGAVDVITEKGTGKAYCLEVNCAPGLAGTTLDKYVEQFQKVM